MLYTPYQFLSFFLIYAFFGWCLEVVYQAVEHGIFINRGFLNGPYCPIYGFGVIIVVSLLDPLKENPIFLYAGSVVLTTVLELVTGFLLEKIFHQHWWDYSNEKFNLHGYICLKFSMLWGVACLIAVRIIHPVIEKFVDNFPHTAGVIFMCLFYIGFTSDLIITILAIVKIRNRIKLLDSISAEMKKISDKTGEKIFDQYVKAKDRKEHIDSINAENRKKLEELHQKYKTAAEKHSFTIRRFEKAFPRLHFDSIKFNDKKHDK